MTDQQDIPTRVAKLEWRADATERQMEKHTEQMAGMSSRMDQHHEELMGEIKGLRDDQTRRQGAEEERERRTQGWMRIARWSGVVISFIGLLIALGYFGTP